MGLSNQIIEDNHYNKELIEFLKEMTIREGFKSDLARISQKMITNGVDSITEIQRNKVNVFIEKYKKRNQCQEGVHGDLPELIDYINVEDFGYCRQCQFEIGKQRSE